MKILLVDDSFYARKLFERILTNEGHEVIEASRGAEALEILKEGGIDLVTVDMLMPEMDGITLIKKIKELNRDIPVVAVTADIQEETKKEAFEAGAIAFITKPVKSEEIKRILSSLQKEPDLIFLSFDNKEAFTELINVAMGRAAYALSTLLQKKIILKVPHFEMMSASRLHEYFTDKLNEVGVAVQQRFSGVINGVATLALPYKDALSLVRVLISADKALERLTPSEQTVLAEVGNIVLNGAISILSNQLKTRLSISIPDVYLKKSGIDVLNSIVLYCNDAEHAIVLLSHLTISEIEIISYLILLIPRAGMLKLLGSLNV
ncbi:MAG TPA: response regulator [Syntrophorhabdaceae bacterium]|nr:response regulator [Syntrophorhabdaceae bacterium]